MPSPSYRLGLIVDSTKVPIWVRDLAEWATRTPEIEFAALIVAPKRNGWKTGLLEVERRVLATRGAYRKLAAHYPVEGLKTVTFEDRDAIAALGLDLIVACTLTSELHGLPSSDGTIAVLVGAEREIACGGFVEVLEGCPATPFTVERLHGAGEQREVLFTGSVATALSYAETVIAVQMRAFQYLRAVVKQLAAGERRSTWRPSAPVARSRATDCLRYAARTAARSAAKLRRRLGGREFNWQVAFVEGAWPDCDLAKATVVPNPANAFLADPFTITANGSRYLFVEEFPYDTRKGVISAYQLENGEARRIGVVLEEPYHLSYPFVFEHEGAFYMVPEGGGGRTVTLYKAETFPTGWVPVKTLLSDVAAVDTLLFRQQDRWWMLTTIKGEGPGLNNAELHAFYADELMGEWTPHPHNPIVMDASKGRNGGFVRDRDGQACRVAQVPGFTFYGAGSAVYRIEEISRDRYVEKLVEEIRPTFFANLDGTHHIHSSEGATVFDFMRVERLRSER